MASTITDVQQMDVQKILVTLSEPEVVIDPGGVAQLVVTMTNQQDTPDRLSLEVEGVDVEWYAIPVPAVNVAPGAQASERILFKVARSSENRAGSYPFLVRVQAMETGEIGVAQATLVVKPFNALQVELNPKRAVATFFHPLNDFDTTITNLGNADETLDLFASDPEDGCAYEFDTDRISLKPGQAQIVPMAVRPKVLSLLGGVRLYGFTVSARSVDDSYVAASAHGQMEKHALISPLLGIFLLLLAFGGGGWWLFRPRPLPALKVNAFEASASRVAYGQPVTLTWDVSKTYKQIILYHRVKGQDVDVAEPQGELPAAVGSIQVKPEYPQTTYKLVVRGTGNQKEVRKEVSVDVGTPPVKKPPRITFFRADPPIIHQGETTILSWDATGAIREFILDPGATHLSQFERTTKPLTPDQDTTFTLRALGADDTVKPASKTAAITVVGKETPLAKIVRFAAPGPVYIGDRIRLKWQTRLARNVRIDTDRGDQLGAELSPNGSLEVPTPLLDTTTFKLTAFDSLGNRTEQTLEVTPQARPVPPPPAEETPPSTQNPTTPPDGATPGPQ